MPGRPGVFVLGRRETMFDIGFSELLVIAVVALIVIGPERLPRVARTAGHLFGRLQRYVNDVKADINREIELEELRKMRTDFEDAAKSVQDSVKQLGTQVNEEVRTAENQIHGAVALDAPAAKTENAAENAAEGAGAPKP